MYHGPDFTSQVLDQWADEHQVRLQFIELGKPTQNVFMESFSGFLCDAFRDGPVGKSRPSYLGRVS